ncbi:MAG: hypothetical protein ACLRQ0_13605 [Monoglobales bacterium]
MEDEKRMIGSYEITHSIHIGEHEIVMGEDLNNDEGYYYIVADCEHADIFKRYVNCLVSDDFTELAGEFASRLDKQVKKLRNDRSVNENSIMFIKENECSKLKAGENIKNKIIVVNPKTLRPEYRTASEQLYFIIGGNGARGHARGSTVFGINLYNGNHTRFERYDVMGTLKPENLPEWAVKNYNSLAEISEQEKTVKKGSDKIER